VEFFEPPNYRQVTGGAGGFVSIFVGDTCGKCEKSVNVPQGAGWKCRCGAYNVLPHSAHRETFLGPDYGPLQCEIQKAAQEVIDKHEVKQLPQKENAGE